MEKTKICRFCLNNGNATEYMDIFNNVASDFLLKVQNCLSFEVNSVIYTAQVDLY